MKLNLGCAEQIIEGWVNVDYALGARLVKLPIVGFFVKKFKLFKSDWDDRIFLHNLEKPLPWPNNSVDVIYTSHTLEHMTKESGSRLLKECFRVLKPKGVLRVIVPDLKSFLQDYSEEKFPAEDFCKKLGVELAPADSLKGILKRSMEFPHQCMYTTTRLLHITKEIGFVANEKKPFESEISDIQMIEKEDRTIRAVIVECLKDKEHIKEQ